MINIRQKLKHITEEFYKCIDNSLTQIYELNVTEITEEQMKEMKEDLLLKIEATNEEVNDLSISSINFYQKCTEIKKHRIFLLSEKEIAP